MDLIDIIVTSLGIFTILSVSVIATSYAVYRIKSPKGKAPGKSRHTPQSSSHQSTAAKVPAVTPQAGKAVQQIAQVQRRVQSSSAQPHSSKASSNAGAQQQRNQVSGNVLPERENRNFEKQKQAPQEKKQRFQNANIDIDEAGKILREAESKASKSPQKKARFEKVNPKTVKANFSKFTVINE